MATLGWRVMRWNEEAFLEKARKAVRGYAEALSPQFDAQLQAVKWTWPNPTERKNTQVVYSPRDVVDLGTLLRSKNLYTPEPGTVVFSWDPVNPATGERYGKIVQTGIGYVDRKGSPVSKPGRDWITPVVRANPFGPGFASAWRALPAIKR